MSDESAWLIEHGKSETSRPQYWVGFTDNDSLWSFDNLAAVRFVRKEDALHIRTCIEREHRHHGTHRVCEHGWG